MATVSRWACASIINFRLVLEEGARASTDMIWAARIKGRGEISLEPINVDELKFLKTMID